MVKLETRTALLLIDLQRGLEDPRFGRLNNPGCAAVAARLLAAWRDAGWPVIHVQHLSREPDSLYRPGQPGCAILPALEPRAGEVLIQKQTNSAFIETGLGAHLDAQGIGALVVAGVRTNNSVEATVRMAGNLGYATYLAADATATVDQRDRDGRLWFAEEVQALSLANLHGEYATVTDSAAIIAALVAQGAPRAANPRPQSIAEAERVRGMNI